MKSQYLLKSLLFTFLLALSGQICAQSSGEYVHQVIIVNEGRFDYSTMSQAIPVTVGTYNPDSKVYSVFATINDVRWASDVQIDDSSVYVAADSLLLVYDKETLIETGRAVIHGIRKIAFYEDKILVTKGDYMVSFDAYFQVYHKSSLSLAYELTTLNGPEFSTEGVVVLNDTAYIAINNGYDFGNAVGKIGIVDLKQQVYKGETDLGPDGINPDNLMIEDGKIYTLNNKDWTGSSISIFNTDDRAIQTKDLGIATGCGTSVKAADYIYYQESMGNEVARFSVNSLATSDTLPVRKNFYGMATDNVNNLIYATNTDFFSYGEAFIMDFNGALVDSFMVGVAPGPIAIDVRIPSSVKNNQISSFRMFPNPASGEISIVNRDNTFIKEISLRDLAGRTVYHEKNIAAGKHTVNISNLPAGVYMVYATDSTGEQVLKLIKQ
jgi:hypothetical protein